MYKSSKILFYIADSRFRDSLWNLKELGQILDAYRWTRGSNVGPFCTRSLMCGVFTIHIVTFNTIETWYYLWTNVEKGKVTHRIFVCPKEIFNPSNFLYTFYADLRYNQKFLLCIFSPSSLSEKVTIMNSDKTHNSYKE